jgi:hypothetical protein
MVGNRQYMLNLATYFKALAATLKVSTQPVL